MKGRKPKMVPKVTRIPAAPSMPPAAPTMGGMPVGMKKGGRKKKGS